jgi:hypothetical protein
MLNRAGSSLEGNLEGTYSAPNVTISAITSDAAQSGTFEGRIDMSGPDYAMTGKVSGRNRLIVMTAFYDVQVQRLAGSWE